MPGRGRDRRRRRRTDAANPAATTLAVLAAFGFLFTISEFAAASLGARHQAEALLAQETAAGEARERAAALAERSRLARDLHDVLAHSLSVLAVQLEAARLTAITEAAGANLVGQITSAHKLTRIGVLNARRALAMLRDDEPPGPASLPGLVSETAAALGIPISLEVDGVPRPLDPEAGLMLYRVVQEALTNVAKHAGRGVRVTVRLAWAAGRRGGLGGGQRRGRYRGRPAVRRPGPDRYGRTGRAASAVSLRGPGARTTVSPSGCGCLAS